MTNSAKFQMCALNQNPLIKYKYLRVIAWINYGAELQRHVQITLGVSGSGSGAFSSPSSIGSTLAVPGREHMRDWPRSSSERGR